MATNISSFQADGAIRMSQSNTTTTGSPSWIYSSSSSIELTQGTAADMINLAYAWDSTIAASGSLVIDLAGALTGEFGQAVTFARIKVIEFRLKTDTVPDGGVLIGAAASNSVVTWQVPVKNTTSQPGYFQLILPDATAIAVTAGSADNFRIVNQSASIAATYRLFIAGSSA